MEKDAKIYVAGHRGLVGSAIVKNLESKGYTNIVKRTHTELDLTDQQAVEAFFAVEKPEYVFLAAAKVGGIVANNTYRADFIYENLQIQNNVIHQSYMNGVKKLMFLGSTCIYPRDCPQPMKEEYLLTSPLEYTNEPYAIAKIAGIKMCESYNLQYGTNDISVMPTNLYGPNDNFDLEKSHVLPALIRKIHLGECLESVKWDVLSSERTSSGASATKKDEAWESVREDLNRLPIEGVTGENSVEEILAILDKYGIKIRNTSHIAHSTPQISIEIWGSGKPMREFLWSEDMADACVFLMENRDFNDVVGEEERGKGEESAVVDGKACEAVRSTYHIARNTEVRNTHVNIGTGTDISIKELAETIKAIVGYNGDLYFNADKPDGTMKKLTDVTKLHALGWRHRIELHEGIDKLYQWYLGVKR